MSSVEELNKLLGIEPKANILYVDEEKRNTNYPPLTYAKQFKIIKFLAKRQIRISEYDNGDSWYIQIGEDGEPDSFFAESNGSFDEVLAYFLVGIWDRLTEEERITLKGIING